MKVETTNTPRRLCRRLPAWLAAWVLLPGGAPVASEADERDALIHLVTDFFEAMTARDVAHMRTLMTPDGIIYGYRETADGLQVIRPTHAEYLDNLASGRGRLVERFWNPRIMLEGRLATVWTPYDLHRDGEFSHCGTNNFSMLKTDAGWVIAGVVFSIRVDDCDESPLGPFRESSR